MALSSAQLLLLLLLPFAAAADPITQYCSGKSFSSGDPLQASINLVLSDLVKRTPRSGYAISSRGAGVNTVYGLTRCRGDVPADACSSCISDAAEKLPNLCTGRADARIWYDYCFLRYNDDGGFIGKADTGYGVILYNVQNATDPVRFDEAVNELMSGVVQAAADDGRRFAWRAKAFTDSVTIRGMAQCTRDLSAASCGQCLRTAVGLFPSYCSFRQGCQVLYSSCVVRYEIYDFLFRKDSSNSRGVPSVHEMVLL